MSAMVATVLGCAESPGETHRVGAGTLVHDGLKWPQNANGVHTVPVCFTDAAAARSDFVLIRDRIHSTVNATWGAAANLQFTGFGTCGANWNGKARVDISDVPGRTRGGTFSDRLPGVRCSRQNRDRGRFGGGRAHRA